MKSLLIQIIKLYQRSLSPDHGWLKIYHPNGFCPFYPSCSQYAIQALTRKGILRGGLLSLRRVWRCRPGRQPSIDPV